LWRGEPFGEVSDVPVLHEAAQRLAERRLVALEDLYVAELAAGHAATIVPELAELAARHPLRERLQANLMTALYRAGRTAEALEVYRRTRAAMVEELGLEPGPELRRVEQGILTGELPEPSAARPGAGGPAELPAGILDFVGRTDHVKVVLDRLGDPDGTVAVISGKAGVGKTALAVHVAHRLRERFPDGQLYVDLRGAGARPLDAAEVLSRFLRALGVGGSAVPDDVDERAALYRSRLAGRRVLVVLDNAAGESQVRPLVPGEPGCGVLVTSRARLWGLETARPLDLDVLDGTQAVELLAAAAGAPRVVAEPDAAEQIVRLCGYLPLAVRIAGARLAARPHWSLSRLAADLDDERLRLDRLRAGDLEVRASFALSHDALGAPARRAFALLGTLDAPDFPAWTAAALLDFTQHAAEDLFDALVDAKLVDVAGRDPVGQQRYRFHDLLRAYARELAAALPDAERLAALRRLTGGWLSLAQDAGSRVPTSYWGFSMGLVPCWRPADEVVAVTGPDPLGWFAVEWAALLGAVEQAFAAGLDQLGSALGLRLSPVFVVRGLYDDWRAICGLTLAGARRSGRRWWEGAALRGFGELDLLQLRIPEAVAHLEGARAAFADAGDEHGTAIVAAGLGAALAELGRDDTGDGEAFVQLDRARALLHRLGDERSLVWVLRRLGRLRQRQLRYADAAAFFEQALDGLDAAEAVAEAGLLERLGEIRTLQGRGDEARTVLERALRLHARHGDLFGEARALRSLGELHRVEGRSDQALNHLHDALRRWREIGFVREQAETLRLLGAAHERIGNPEAAETARREAALLG
ncbi:MAG: ATP-binding protein, partial [Pseudonocardia sp.]